MATDWKKFIKETQQQSAGSGSNEWKNFVAQEKNKANYNNTLKQIKDLTGLEADLETQRSSFERNWNDVQNTNQVYAKAIQYFSKMQSVSNELKRDASGYKKLMGDKAYNDLLKSFDEVLKNQDVDLKAIMEQGKFYTTFKTADEYNTDVKNQGYADKYKNRTYQQISDFIKSDDYNTMRRRGLIDESEAKWLRNQKYALGTSTQLQKELDSIEDLLKKAESIKKTKGSVTVSNMGNEFNPQKSIMPDKSDVAKANENFENQIKALGYKNVEQFNNDIENKKTTADILKTVIAQKKQIESFNQKWGGIKVEENYQPKINENETDSYYIAINQITPKALKSKTIKKHSKSALINDRIVTNSDYFAEMEPEEKNKYNKIYETKGITTANQYADDLISLALDKRLNEKVMQKNYDFTSKNGFNAVVGSIASVGESLGSGIEYVTNLLKGETDRRVLSATRAQGLREGTKSHWDSDVWDFVYDTTMSGIDSASGMALSVAVPYLGEALLGGSAAAHTFNNALDRGVPQGDAVLSSLAAGVAESLFEHVSIGTVLKGGKITAGWTKKGLLQATKKTFVDMGVNFSEETLTEISNVITDRLINGELSNYDISVRDYYMQGLSPEDAKRKAAEDVGTQIGMAGLSGMLMGFGFGTIGSTYGLTKSQMLNSKAGSNVVKNGEVEALKTLAKDSGIAKIQKAAEKIDKNSKPSKIGYVFNSLLEEYSKNSIQQLTTALLENGATERGSNSAKGWATQILKNVVSPSNKEAIKQEIALRVNKLTGDVYANFVDNGKYGGDALLNLLEIGEDAPTGIGTQSEVKTGNTVINDQGVEVPVAADGEGAAVGPVMGDTVKGIASAPRSGEIRTITEAYKQGVAENLEKQRPNPKTAKAEAETKGKTEEEIYFEEYFAKEKQITPEEEQILKDFAKENGLKVEFTDKAVDGKAYGRYADGTIVISRYAKKPMRALFKHEFSHSVENAKGYAKFQEYVLEKSNTFKQWLNLKGYGKWSELSDKITETYKKDKVKYDNAYAAAKADIVADFVGDVLFGEVVDAKGNPIKLDTNFLVELKKNDRNLFQRFVEWVHSILKRLTTKGVVNKDIVKLEQKFKRLAEQARQQRAKGESKKSQTGEADGQYSLAEDEKLYTYINDALSDKLPKKSFYKISDKISDRLANDIEKIVGFSVEDYSNEITPSSIMHIEKQHGTNGKKDSSMQDHHDLARVSYVIDNYEKITEGKRSGEYKNSDGTHAKTVVLQAKVDNQFYYVVEAVPDAKLKALHVVSAYKNKKDTFPNVPVSNDPRRYVQDEHRSNVSNPSIPNSTENVKQKQLDIILKNNPANSDYVTWIRSVDDIHTLQETLEMSDWAEYDEYNPDYSKQDALDAIEKGKILVYSSKPISQGIFVTPSRMEAESYSGNGKVYKKLVNIEDVAWIDPTQGQFAKVEDDIGSYSLPEIDNEGNKLSEGQRRFFDKSKLTDEQGNLLRLYHGSRNGGFTKFSAKYSDDGITLFLTPSRELAGTYTDSMDTIKLPEGKKGLARMFETGTDKGKGQSGIYEVYVNAKNPYILECNGEWWNRLPFTEKLKGKTIFDSENTLDPNTNTFKTKVTIDGKVYEKTFDLNHIVEKVKKVQENHSEGINKEVHFKYDFADLSTPEIFEYYRTFANETIAEELKRQANLSMYLRDGITRTFKTVYDNKTGDYTELNTRFVGKWAKEKGYDSVWLKNVRDTGTVSQTVAKDSINDVVIAFDSSQIKSVDNLEPTKNKDIRYSLPDDGIPKIARGKSYKELDALVKEGKITSDEAFKALGEENGTMPKGERPKVDVNVPEKVSKTKNVNQFMRNVLESGHLDADMTEREKRNIISGARTYNPISDKAALDRAEKKIKADVNGAVQEWENAINGNRRITKYEIALGEQLLVQAAETGNANDVTRYVAELAELGTQLGQDIQALRLLKQMTGMGQLYYVTRAVARLNKDIESRYGEKHKIVEIDPNLANILANAKSEAEIDDVVKDLIKDVASQVESSWVDKFNSWRYLAMLGNPRTHFRNIVGNAVFMPAVGTKNKIAAIMETMFVDKENRTKTFGFLKPEYKDFATEDFKKVEEIIKGGGKMNPADQIRDQMKVYNSKAFAWLEGVRQFNFNALEIEDGWFLKGHYVRALGGAMQARGLDVNNIEPAQLEELRTYAIKEAQKATYRDASHFAQTLNKLAHPGKDASLLSKAAGVAVEGLLPFKKTPINILKRGIEYSPIGIATSIADAVIAAKKGQYSGTQFIDGLSSGLTGTGIMLLGAFFWSIGWISGGMDYDDEDALERLAGKQPYALKVGDYTFTIDFAAPAVLPFMVGAETAKILNGKGNDDAIGFFDAIAAMGAPMTELSMLQGLNDAIETIAYSDNKMGDFATNIFASYFSQYVPTIGGQIARTFDSTRRTNFVDKNSPFPKIIQTTYQKALGKIPGAENTKVPYIDAWGRTEENDNFLLRAFENFVSPGYISKVTDDSVNNELAKIYTDTGESGVIPKRASTSFEVSGERVNLNADEYVQYATDKGQYSRKYLEEIMSSDLYNGLSSDGKAEAIAFLFSYANDKAKSNVSDYDYREISTYKTAAKLEDAGISPASYAVAKFAMSKENADTDGSDSVTKSEKQKALRDAGFSSRDANKILNINKK